MLHNLCQDLTQAHVSEFLFLCDHEIARSRQEKIKDPRDLLCALEQLNLVGPNNLHFMSSKLTEICRPDLAQKVEAYCLRHGVGDSAQSGSGVRQVLLSVSESSNHVMSYKPARVLERDDAVPVVPRSQHMPTLACTDWQESLSSVADSLCYPMDKRPRGNI